MGRTVADKLRYRKLRGDPTPHEESTDRGEPEQPVSDPEAETPQWDYLLRAWQDVDVPEGWRAEIREAGIVLVPPPPAIHNEIPELITRQLLKRLPDDIAVQQWTGIAIPHLERLRAPDLLVFPRAAIPEQRGVPLDPMEVMLIVEVTSPDNAEDDRGPKRVEYAQAGVPLYLLVDAHHHDGARITLFSNPWGSDYADSHTVAWAEAIHLPEPFGLKLDTAACRRPAN
jgi:Uma2 family endonuclease